MTTTTAEGVGFRSERGPILIALMLSTGLVAIDSTIVATAVPSIVHDVGGFTSFPWLFSAYLLAQAVSVPVYAKLSDIVGRKPIILIGIGLFLLGSILCGLAWSMPALIAFRVLQGLGAGAVQPMAITIAGDIYTLAERAKVQGYLASVWAVSSVVGPTLGGRVLLARHLARDLPRQHPAVPAGRVDAASATFHENVERAKHRVDYLGAGTADRLAEPAHPRRPRGRPGVGVELAHQHRGLRRRSAAVRRLRPGRAAGGRAGAAAVGRLAAAAGDDGADLLRRRCGHARPHLLRAHVPRRSTGDLPDSGRARAGGADHRLADQRVPVGPPLSSDRVPEDRPDRRHGHGHRNRRVLAVTASTPNVVLVAAGCFVVGLGLGLVATPTLIAAQSSVEWNERGVVTGTNLFARSIGSSIGVAVFGAVANAIYAGTPAAMRSAHDRVGLHRRIPGRTGRRRTHRRRRYRDACHRWQGKQPRRRRQGQDGILTGLGPHPQHAGGRRQRLLESSGLNRPRACDGQDHSDAGHR